MNKPQTTPEYKQQVRIRRAKMADAEVIAQLAEDLANLSDSHTQCTSQTVRDDMLSEASPCVVFVAEQGGVVVGFAFIYVGYNLESAEYGYHLADICVDKASQREGIGKALMQHIAEFVLADGKFWLSWTVLDDNEAAMCFYDALKAMDVPVAFKALGPKGLRRLADK